MWQTGKAMLWCCEVGRQWLAKCWRSRVSNKRWPWKPSEGSSWWRRAPQRLSPQTPGPRSAGWKRCSRIFCKRNRKYTAMPCHDFLKTDLSSDQSWHFDSNWSLFFLPCSSYQIFADNNYINRVLLLTCLQIKRRNWEESLVMCQWQFSIFYTSSATS